MTLPQGKDQETAISRETQAGIAEMKGRLADFILAYMRCQPENADIEGIEVDLSRLGWARPFDLGKADGGRRRTAAGKRAGLAPVIRHQIVRSGD